MRSHSKPIAKNKPHGNPKLVGDGRDVQSKLPLLVEADQVYPRQIWDLKVSKNMRHTVMHKKERASRERRSTLLQAEIGWLTMGCPAKGTSGFGTFNDSGLNRVPEQRRRRRRRKQESRTWILKKKEKSNERI